MKLIRQNLFDLLAEDVAVGQIGRVVSVGGSVEGLIDDGQPVPPPKSIDDHQHVRDYRGGTWGVVSIDPASLRLKTVRVNITVPERVLDAVDRFAASSGRTRSGLLVEAVTGFMGRDGAKSGRSKPSGKR